MDIPNPTTWSTTQNMRNNRLIPACQHTTCIERESVPSLIIQTLTFSPKVLTFPTSSFLPTLLTRPCNRCLSVLFLDKCTGASVKGISSGSKWTVLSGTKNDWADVRIVFRAWLERDGLIESRIAVNILWINDGDSIEYNNERVREELVCKTGETR
jgi:hypothetical protein